MALQKDIHPDDYDVQLQAAMQHLSANDALLAPVITAHGVPKLRPHSNYFEALASAIISQQLSTTVARVIRQRLVDLFDGNFPTADLIMATPEQHLRAIGISGRKVSYLKDLSAHVVGGNMPFDSLDSLDNDDIIAHLTQIHGIGVWSVHMFLIFCVGRLDVLAVGDLGIRSGIAKLYRLDQLPTPHEANKIAMERQWSPYRSVACWYLWRALDTPT